MLKTNFAILTLRQLALLIAVCAVGGCASNTSNEASHPSAADPQAGLKAAQQGAAKARQDAQAAAAARGNQPR